LEKNSETYFYLKVVVKYKQKINLDGDDMNTAKDIIRKLIEDIPESKAGEVIDFLMYLKNRKEQDLYMDSQEEEEIWNLIKTDERVSSEKVNELLKGE
jgi:hypothetical protein